MVIRLLVSALLAYIVMGVATLFVVTDVNGRPHKKQIENRGPLVLPSAAYRRSHKNYLRRAGAAGTIASIIVVVGFLIISHPSTTTGAKYALGHEKVNKITVTWHLGLHFYITNSPKGTRPAMSWPKLRGRTPAP
jgi:hypothetical protein